MASIEANGSSIMAQPFKTIRVRNSLDASCNTMLTIRQTLPDTQFARRRIAVMPLLSNDSEPHKPAASVIRTATSRRWRIGTDHWEFGGLPKLMGIINVTPDSFSDGGQFDSVSAATEHALKLLDEGADILDIGGESTRPGAMPVSLNDELQRVLPVVRELARRTRVRSASTHPKPRWPGSVSTQGP